jgi:CubicO group peptidase (beta-lactamase class C family)
LLSLKNKIMKLRNLFLFGFFLILLIFSCQNPDKPKADISKKPDLKKLIARADSFELNTPYEAPPGDALSHHASGFAKVLCSAVFITGLDFEFAAENIGLFIPPAEIRAQLINRTLDMENKAVHITLPNGVVRTAKYYGAQGCISLPEGKNELNFKPVDVKSSLPDPNKQLWPMGDVISKPTIPKGVNLDKVRQAIDTLFNNPEAMTAAFVVTYKGQIIGERYREGLNMYTKLENWSMGKSITATLMGILIQQGVYKLYQPAPIPEWQVKKDDPRASIRIADLLRMSSGLRFRAPLDPGLDLSLGYPDHFYVYTGAINSFSWAATRPQQWPPNKVGRYRNSDPVLTNYLIRLGVEKRGEEYLSFPQRALFDKLGMRNMILETDPYGNFLLQGYEFGTARDWARLGNLYLNDGIWMGERILADGFVKFVSTLAPAWVADGRPVYGGFFWINGDGAFPIPKDAYFMGGAGGQHVFIIPSHDLVVVKLTHYKGEKYDGKLLAKALPLLLEAVPGK